MPIQNTHSARWNPKPFAIPCVRIFGLGLLFIPTKNLKPTFKMLIDIIVIPVWVVKENLNDLKGGPQIYSL